MIQMSGPLSPEKELEKLREAFDSLNDVARGVETALAHIDLMNFGTAKDQLKAVKWHIGEVKKRLTEVGHNRKQTLTTQK
jgi:hypothetical protein